MSLSGRAAATRSRGIRQAIRVSRSMGSAALALVYVANGRFDAFVQQGGLSTWDIAAAGLIAERAGAPVTSLDGGPWFEVAARTKSIGILAAPPCHHADLLRRIVGRLAGQTPDDYGLTRGASMPILSAIPAAIGGSR